MPGIQGINPALPAPCLKKVLSPESQNTINQTNDESKERIHYISSSETFKNLNHSTNLLHKNNLSKFKELTETLQLLYSIKQILSWDMTTYMPKEAYSSRGQQVAVITKHEHDILTSKEMSYYLDYLQGEDTFTTLSFTEQALVKEVKNLYDKGKNTPIKLLEELEETIIKAQYIRSQAYESENFNIFAPILEKIISLKKDIVSHSGYKGSPYDALLDVYEPGMTSEKLDGYFKKLKDELIPFIKKINDSKREIESNFLHKQYDQKKESDVVKEVLDIMGFDFSRGRIDFLNRAFSQEFVANDTRLVTPLFENNIFYTIITAMHEGGHGLYDQGFEPTLEKTPLYDAASLGMHESQSRLYETIFGQGLPFWKFYFPKLQKYFSEELKEVTLEQFYLSLNKLEISPHWTEADEITHNIHIMIRYEVERDLMNGKISVKDVPTVWSQKMQDYLGVTPQNDLEGALQNSHWSEGDIGYFPTYTLGNLYAAQIYNTIKKEIPKIEEYLGEEEFKDLNKWLKEKIYKYGKTLTPKELLIKVTGEELNPDYLINYIKDKYSKIYDIDLSGKEPVPK